MPRSVAISRFNKLISDISRIYSNARQAQVKFAWETGRRIVEEEQSGAMRAHYGARLIPALSEALSQKYGPGFSENTLRKMRQFYIMQPIQPISAELDWSDYVELLPVKDEATRRRLQGRIRKEGLSAFQIRQLVRKVLPRRKKLLFSPLPPLKRPCDLRLNTFAKSPLRVNLEEGEALIDCGFFVSWPVQKEELAGLTIVDEPSYTYAARIERVIDGDTLLALIQVGFKIIVRDKLRLRGVDTPELGTPEGEKAKKFVEKLLPVGSTVVIKSHKCQADIYGRFVADVFYRKGIEDSAEILKDAVYLNQQLLDEGLAARMEG
ncbi:MAG: thermonuclease family protein [Candidatus Omnitrophica bacterium]|nr:thermonuclease family protein [Candidatus Omnitrophota bacterium]